jgi:hypothetical protein
MRVTPKNPETGRKNVVFGRIKNLLLGYRLKYLLSTTNDDCVIEEISEGQQHYF